MPNSELMTASDTALVKRQLRAQTEHAVELGGFGVPLMAIPTSALVRMPPGSESKTHQIWFGSDRFEQMAFFLGKTWLGPNPPTARL
jgi:2-hydroxychromene-2-carboxylate isomerase